MSYFKNFYDELQKNRTTPNPIMFYFGFEVKVIGKYSDTQSWVLYLCDDGKEQHGSCQKLVYTEYLSNDPEGHLSNPKIKTF